MDRKPAPLASKVTPHPFKGDGPACATCDLGKNARVHTMTKAEYEFQLRGKKAASQKPGSSKETARLKVVEPPPAAAPLEPAPRPTDAVERAFLTRVGEKTILTARATIVTDEGQLPREMATAYRQAGGNKNFLWLQGSYVEADRPNGNGAFWTTEDLQIGEPTVKHGPVNMLHQERHIIGTITDAKLYLPGTREEAMNANSHIVAQSAIWKFLFPGETAAIERAATTGHLWQSMECTAERIVCQTSDDGSRVGCNREVAWEEYEGYLMGKPAPNVCNHLRERSSQRRFQTPSFLGTAIVLPPARPAWGQADTEIMREAATAIEGMTVRPNLPDAELEQLIAQVIAYGKGA
ncbi:MAG: hypothetical protein ACXVYY_01405 [Oryzihumus sp.]